MLDNSKMWKLSAFLLFVSALMFCYLNWTMVNKYGACQVQYQTLKNQLEKLVNSPPEVRPDIEVQLLFVKPIEL